MPFALDTVLHNAANLFRRNTGSDLYALGELEFFLPQRHAFASVPGGEAARVSCIGAVREDRAQYSTR